MDYAKKIERVCQDFVQMHSAYRHAQRTIKAEQWVMQDISHKLEIYRTTDQERQRLATIYANAARQRRQCKETVEVLSPLFRALGVGDLSDRLSHVVAEMAQVQERQKKRQYTPRSGKIRFDDVEKFYKKHYKGDKSENAKCDD